MAAMSVLKDVPDLKSTHSQLFVGLCCVASWSVCMTSHVPVFPFGILIPLLSIASATDLMVRRIPNWLTYSAAGFALAAAAVVSLRTSSEVVVLPGVVDFRESVSGFATTFGIMLMVYLVLGIGAGDVKLAGAIGACVGAHTGLQILLWTHLIAGAAAGVYVVWKVGPRWLIQKSLSLLLPDRVLMPTVNHSDTLRYPVPMAVYFSLGTIVALLEVPLL